MTWVTLPVRSAGMPGMWAVLAGIAALGEWPAELAAAQAAEDSSRAVLLRQIRPAGEGRISGHLRPQHCATVNRRRAISDTGRRGGRARTRDRGCARAGTA